MQSQNQIDSFKWLQMEKPMQMTIVYLESTLKKYFRHACTWVLTAVAWIQFQPAPLLHDIPSLPPAFPVSLKLPLFEIKQKWQKPLLKYMCWWVPQMENLCVP